MVQSLHRADEPVDAGSAGLVLLYADANWQHVLKAGSVAPRKKQGLTAAWFRLRAEVTLDAKPRAVHCEQRTAGPGEPARW